MVGEHYIGLDISERVQDRYHLDKKDNPEMGIHEHSFKDLETKLQPFDTGLNLQNMYGSKDTGATYNLASAGVNASYIEAQKTDSIGSYRRSIGIKELAD